jgi:glycine betaine/proline transport system ATP-binding protein
MNEAGPRILCLNLWKIFGPHPDKIIESADHDITKADTLSKTGHVIAVKDVSLEIYEGELFVIMGLSGSGKSTLIRCINGLVEPSSGEIFVDGEEVNTLSDVGIRELRRKKLSMVFQHFALFPHRSVIDNVAYGLEIQGVDRDERNERALKMLELVGLKGWENSEIDELSGGMQQRVGLARALAVEPEILLMDEPFSALDPLIRRQMQEEFINLLSVVHKTVLFVTHDLNEALKLGDRIAVMKDGEIVQVGTPDDIVLSPVNDYVTEFARDVPKAKVLWAKTIMEEPEAVVSVGVGIEQALQVMEEKNLSHLFVTNEDGKLKGVVSLNDTRDAVQKGSTDLNQIINTDFPMTKPSKIVEDLVPLAADSDIPIVVTDSKQKLLGIISQGTLLRALSEKEDES